MSSVPDTRAAWLADVHRAGLFACDEETADAALIAATHRRFAAYRIDLRGVSTRQSFLIKLGRSLRFPDWYGENWDALEDCLTDLSWCAADGYVLVLQGLAGLTRADPQAVQTAFEVLAQAADFWRGQEIPFWVLVPGSDAALARLSEP